MVIYNGFYTKIMQRNYNQTLFGKDILKFKRSVVYRCIDQMSAYSFYFSIVSVIILKIIASVNRNQFERYMLINFRTANEEFFAEIGYLASFAFEILPISCYILYDLSCFLTCCQEEKLYGSLVSLPD